MNTTIQHSIINSNIDIFIVFILIGLGAGLYFLNKKLNKNLNEKSNSNNFTENVKKDNKKDTKVDVKYLKELKSYLDEILKDKFEYLLINEILPIYYAGKTLDKNKLKELNDDFYFRVSLNLSKEVKYELKKHFNEEGIKFYINEKFINYLNKIDKTMSNKEPGALTNKDLSSLVSLIK